MATTTPEEVRKAKKTAKPPRPIPEPDSDFYSLKDCLAPDEAKIVQKVRAFMEEKVAPVITKYWAEDAFPFELLPGFRQLGICGVGFHGYGCPGGSPLLAGFIAMETARVDASFSTFFGAHSGLSMGSIYLGGSEEQKQRWLPPMARLELVGAFGLTEPLVGFRREQGAADHGEAGGRHLGAERREEVDRELAVVRCHGHLGEGRSRRSGQGLRRREQEDAGFPRRED